MNVIATDKFLDKVTIEISISTGQSIKAEIIIQPFDKLITNSDFISLHVFNYYWYVFNIADIAIVFGGLFVLIDLTKDSFKKK